jgi:hypothetical protein
MASSFVLRRTEDEDARLALGFTLVTVTTA